MKRRNADCGKLRRPMKRNKITESMYGSTTVLYMKFLVLWAIVITADFMCMFRFEFLWPFWLLLRSVHDSFKYKGLAFSVLFICIAITSDLVCLFFIPVHWLLFAASTYVWVQYVWHTDKGVCLPTIFLWMLFVYLEAGIRWKDSRHMPHLDLCRPFAAHCIGYPVVTLGFGFKSYVGFRMRQRKQREVSKENEFYMQLLQQALPQEDSVTSEAKATIATATTIVAVSKIKPDTGATTNSGGCHATVTSVSVANQHHHNHQNQHNCIGSSTITSAIVTAVATGCNSVNSSIQQQQQQLSNNITKTANGNAIMFAGALTVAATATTTATTTTATTLTHNNHQQQQRLLNQGSHDHKHYNGSLNGHVGGNKNQRRNYEKEIKQKGGGTSSHTTDNKNSNGNNTNYHQLSATDTYNNNHNKGKSEWETNGNHQNCHQQTYRTSSKEKENNNNNSRHEKNINNNMTSKKMMNGGHNINNNQHELDDVVTVEPIEKLKVGRRNRSKKDNHRNNNNNAQHTNNNYNAISSNKESSALMGQQHRNNSQNHNNNNGNHNSDASSVSSSASSTTEKPGKTISNKNNKNGSSSNYNHRNNTNSTMATTATIATTTTTTAIRNLTIKVKAKICESCTKFEADIRKYRSDISHMKHVENELKQKLETNLTTKSCLLAKQKECDELEKRINELTSARHADILQLQVYERRLAEERRQKQSVDALLNNEKKARKLAEEKASRPECSTQCKQRRQCMDEEIKQLRRDLKLVEEAKQLAEQHGRKWEQELRMFEAEIRNRESVKPGTDALMNALVAMQDKNCTLEKNLSSETRVKLDLFSALGDAKRQLEISENLRRSKEDEVQDLKAKIAQLLAVMPTDSLCLPACSSTGASSMLRMNTPPLQTGPGPSSPILHNMGQVQVNHVQVQQQPQHQQQHLQHQQKQMIGGGRCSSNPTAAVDYVQQQKHQQQQHKQHQQQQQCVGIVPVSVATSVLVSASQLNPGSNLDPNASIYTPKVGSNNVSCANGIVVVGNGTASGKINGGGVGESDA